MTTESGSTRPLFGLLAPRAVLVLVITALVYAPVLRADLLGWDDPVNIAANPVFRERTANALYFFWVRPYAGLYVPVTYTLWLTEARLGGLTQPSGGGEFEAHPWVFHAANLVWHLLATAGVMALAWRILECVPGAIAAGLVFGLHPLHVESVAWVTEAKGLLAGAASLWALYLYVAWSQRRVEAAAQDGPRPGMGSYWAAGLLFVLALLSKPSAVPIPLVALVLDVTVVKRRVAASLASLAPWFLASAACVAVTRQVQTAFDLPQAGFAERMHVAIDALAFYITKFAWPTGLAVDYGRQPAVALAEPLWPSIAIVLGTVAVAVLLPGRRGLALGLALFVILLAPNLGLVPFDYQRFSTVADRYAYLAILGPALAAAALIARVWWQPALRAIALLVALATTALWGVTTYRQAERWADDQTLFSQTYRINPRSAVACNALGNAARRRRDLASARQWYTRATQLEPSGEGAYFNLGQVYELEGRTAEAVAMYRRALDLRPGYEKAARRLEILLGPPAP